MFWNLSLTYSGAQAADFLMPLFSLEKQVEPEAVCCLELQSAGKHHCRGHFRSGCSTKVIRMPVIRIWNRGTFPPKALVRSQELKSCLREKQHQSTAFHSNQQASLETQIQVGDLWRNDSLLIEVTFSKC